MNADFFHEPNLEFGVGKHIDIKFGLMNYGPLDFQVTTAPKKIKLGIIGTPETIEGVQKWIEKCRNGVPAKKSKRPNLFPRFPGFGKEMMLCADFVFDSQLCRVIPERKFIELCKPPRTDDALRAIADLFLSEMEYLAQKNTADILVCAYPFTLIEFLDQEDEEAVRR